MCARVHAEIPINLLQGDQPQIHQASHIFSCNHASVKVQASCPAYLVAVVNTNNKYYQLKQFYINKK